MDRYGHLFPSDNHKAAMDAICRGELIGWTCVTGAWGVGAMIFFKVAMDAAFYKDISIIGSALLALMVAATLFISAGFYAVKFGQHQARVLLGTASNFLFACLPIWIVTVLSNIILGKLIVFGFSKKLNRDLGGDVFYDLGRSFLDESLLFAAIIAIPITLHLLMILMSARRPDREEL